MEQTAATTATFPTHTGPAPLTPEEQALLAQAAELIRALQPEQLARRVQRLAASNQRWRGRECINLLAPEALMSPMARRLLSSELSQRAGEGHIGNRWFAGTRFIDQLEALTVELAKQVFRCRYADHRLVSGMVGNAVVYFALTRPGDTIMTLSQPAGGHSGNRWDGPAGMRGVKIVDVPFDPEELTVDLEAFTRVACQVRPTLVALGSSLTLFPYPLREMRTVLDDLGAKLYFDGAHQMGLIAGGQFQDPLRQGADVITGSTGKTLSGPQGGLIVWDRDDIAEPLRWAIFPGLAATHQINRVAALAVALAELLAFGKAYMAQVVANAQALGQALAQRRFQALGARKNFTCTHQLLLDVRAHGRGLAVAQLLAQANIITNKNLLPTDIPASWDYPSGLRLGTTEVTRLGMRQPEMEAIAELMRRVVLAKEPPQQVARDAIALRESFQTVQYCFQ